jgi:microcystin-dependent protein
LAAALALAGLVVSPNVASAQAEPFIGQMMATGAFFCPRGWAEASGQLLSIAQNTALFSLLGTTYGGNGQTTFGLPDLRGRTALHVGQGPGLSSISQGEIGGSEAHTLSINEMPAHTHQAFGSQAPPVELSPDDMVVARQDRVRMYTPPGALVGMAPEAIGVTGGNQPFSLRSPYVGVRWCIAIEGIYPSQP